MWSIILNHLLWFVNHSNCISSICIHNMLFTLQILGRFRAPPHIYYYQNANQVYPSATFTQLAVVKSQTRRVESFEADIRKSLNNNMQVTPSSWPELRSSFHNRLPMTDTLSRKEKEKEGKRNENDLLCGLGLLDHYLSSISSYNS